MTRLLGWCLDKLCEKDVCPGRKDSPNGELICSCDCHMEGVQTSH